MDTTAMPLSSSPAPALSLVVDVGEYSSTCGYCNSTTDKSTSYGMEAQILSVETYQELLDRGWRRSGRWLYRPCHSKTCCQLMTIRVNAHEFQPNREHKRTLRKWESYLDGAPLRAPQKPNDNYSKDGNGSDGGHGDDEDHNNNNNAEQVEAPTAAMKKIPSTAAMAIPGAKTSSIIEEDSALLTGGSPKRPFYPSSRGLSFVEGGGKRMKSAAIARLSSAGSGSWRDIAAEGMPIGRPPSSSMGRTPTSMGRTPSISTQLTSFHLISNQKKHQLAGGGVGLCGVKERKHVSAEDISQTLHQALDSLVQGGNLPAIVVSLDVKGIKVNELSGSLKKHLPKDVHLTSPLAHVITSMCRKQSRGSGSGCNNGDAAPMAVEQVADLLVEALKSNNLLPSGITVASQKGHLNFGCTESGEHDFLVKIDDGDGSNKSSDINNNIRKKRSSNSPVTEKSSPPLRPASPQVARHPPRNFLVRTLRSDDPSIPDIEYPLFRKYQIMHHNDDPSEVSLKSFKRFLCDSPLRPVGPEDYPPGKCPLIGFGSFHQQYWIDGRLVAVGVVDILPRCLSSKYLFWDPDMGPLSLGKLTSLMEIDWVRSASQVCPSLQHYYLGFYIHNCHRMRYKAEFGPAELLCPKYHCWVPLEKAKPVLDATPHGMVVLGSEEEGEKIKMKNDGDDTDLGDVKLFVDMSTAAHNDEHDDGDSDDEERMDKAASSGGRQHQQQQNGSSKSRRKNMYVERRHGRIFTFRQLQTLGALTSAGVEEMRQRLTKWMDVVGPAWRQLAWHL